MKNKFAALFGTLLIIFAAVFGTMPVFALNDKDKSEAQAVIDGILNYNLKKSGSASVQEWIDGSMTKEPQTSEWYILSLAQSGDYAFSRYENALKEYLKENTVRSAVSSQKYALTLVAIGSCDEYIYEVLSNSVGKQGIMSWVFGLHLLNNGYKSDEYTVEQVCEKLISLQLADGGWAVSGTVSDADTTAMAVQSLAPYYTTDLKVKTVVDKALSTLSTFQNGDGDFSSYGIPNAESTAQVITALSSLDIDGETDQRFIKNGKTLFDGLKKYQLKDGNFCHKTDGEESDFATTQALYASVAYIRMCTGKSNFYMLDNRNPEGLSVGTPSEKNSDKSPADNTPSTLSAKDSEKGFAGGYKLWVSFALLLSGAIGLVVLRTTKRLNKKNITALLVLLVVLLCFVFFTDFKTADSYYSSEDISKKNPVGSVTMDIRCDTVAGKTDSKYIPKDGTILKTTEFVIEKGETVYSILLEAARTNKIQIENNGTDKAVYISGINYLYEFDFGDLSGWVYRVNGKESSVSCGDHELKDGDKIEWLYTCELGKDLE